MEHGATVNMDQESAHFMTQSIPQLSVPFPGFEEAAQSVLKFLHERMGFKLWMLTRTEGDDWIVLKGEDHGYGVKSGDVFSWADSFCSRMVLDLGPQIAPRSAAVSAYASAPIGTKIPIGAYIGIPLKHSTGKLFGTLCAIDPLPQPEAIIAEAPLIQLLAQLLSTLLSKELETQETIRRLEHAQAESMRDHLTGLFNRRGWDKFLEAEEDRCKRFGSPAAVIIIDLDELKSVNDLNGHAAGDLLLRAAADCIRNALRSFDVAARIGGDEFIVLAVEIGALQSQKLAERLRGNLDAAGVRASIGWALRNPRKDLKAAVEAADQQMYQEKQRKKKSD